MGSEPKLRVLFVINGLGTGGAERSIIELIRPLRARGIELEIICLFPRSEGVIDLVEGNTPVRLLTADGWWRRLAALRRVIATNRFDVVHTTIFEADLLGRFAAIGTGVPVLSSVVNMSYEAARLSDPRVGRWKLASARALDAWTARHLTAHIHVLTEAVGRSVVERLGVPSNRITVVGRGRDPRRLGEPSSERRRSVRHSLGLDEDHRVLLSVGRLEYQKGHRHMVEAMPRILYGFPEARLLIAGRAGNVSVELAELVDQLALNDSIRFLGHREDVGDLLSAADVFVFPSLFEGFGGAMLEAMAMGLPIVASDLPPLREVSGVGGALLVEPGSARALEQGTVAVLSDPSLAQRLGQTAKDRFQSLFTVEGVADRMTDMYRRTTKSLPSD
jgi:glycosyltransferase involved in cell wall biosynthesis